MIEFSEEDFLLKPYHFQYDGIRHLLKNKHAAIFDEMGVGKSKQAIDAASILFKSGQINAVIVVSPSSVRGVWDREHTGEIAKHCKSDYVTYRFDNKFKYESITPKSDHLVWITVSYSFLRARLEQFTKMLKKSHLTFLFVLDESSYVKSRTAAQTKACWKIRQFAARSVLLNGTPIANSIVDLWAQFNILDPQAINYMNYFHFRAKYAIMGGWKNKQTFSFDERKLEQDKKKLVEFEKMFEKYEKDNRPIAMLIIQMESLRKHIAQQERVRNNVEELKNQLSPWIIRREKKDVLTELPPKLDPVILETPLSKDGYAIYCEMRDQMVAWANNAQYSEAVNGAVKIARLAQITSGYMGGIQDMEGEFIPDPKVSRVIDIDSAKIDTFLEWYENNKHLKVLVWSRFRHEMHRLRDALQERGVRVGMLIGGQTDEARQGAINAFREGEIDVMIGNAGAGGFGLDGFQTHCYTCVYISMDHSLIKYQQSSDRLHRNGQLMPVSYIFIVATTPNGEKTVDHLVIDAVMNKENMASYSMDKWRSVLGEI